MSIATKLMFLIVLTGSLFASFGADMGTTGKIAGRITDSATGDPLPFVNVIIMGTTLGAATDLDGYYSILNIPPGNYSVKASAIGFNTTTFTNVTVSIDLTSTVDFTLAVTSLELGEEVVVIAQRKMIQQDLTASTAIVDARLIKELPVTEISDVLALQAGIVVSPDGAIHLRGGRSGQIAYQIDGVPVTDSYDGSVVVEVNTSAVQELQVVSGAFNAEYGQALSGVVNLVTKDGNNDFKGSVQSYIGDYVSDRNNVFWNIDELNPISVQNYEASLSGPIIKDNLFFFTNLRYYKNQGYFYGKRYFLVTDYASEVPGSAGGAFNINSNGDSNYVSLNPTERIYGQAKISYRLMEGMKVSYNFMIENQNMKFYDGGARLTPDNNLRRFEKSYSNILSLNHAISASSFYTLNLSYYFKDYRHFLFEDIYTGNPAKPTNYVDNSWRQTPPYSFNIGGTNHNRFSRNSGTMSAKLDWATQATREINVQFGGDLKEHRLFYKNVNLVPQFDENGQKASPYNVVVPPVSTTDHDVYLHKPREGAAYVQAKFEAFNMIFNAGLRFDIFEPDGVVLNDPSDPNYRNPLKPSNQFNDLNDNGIIDQGETYKSDSDRLKYWFKDASVKTQLSPRLGIAFPITDRGVIHFSYGYFFQLPRYELLYQNPDFELGVGSGNAGLFGNADLYPQKTVKGEIGLQQQIGEDIAIDVTMFFEDFRNLTGTQTDDIIVFGRAQSYSKYSNSDFGFSKGIIVKFTQRFSGGLATNLDYTYSVTKGNASNPSDARNAVLGGALPETFIVPLDWDQTHTLNISVAYTKPGDFGFSIIGNFFSGQPYSPGVNKNTRVTQNAFPRNSDNKPTVFNVDMRVYKDIDLLDYEFSVFLKVFNLFDSDNATGVYGDSGDPYFTFSKYEATLINPTLYTNSLNELYTNPTFFSEPRKVEVGVSYNF
ncbi:MAG: TonB-dependent receptor [Bacteroidetes bacterium]|nr:TonB-dependent receptor [Bacteroidota bacterium]